MVEARASAPEAAATAELPAMRKVGVTTVSQAVAVPVGSPVVPTPAEATEQADADSQAELDPRSVKEESRVIDPARIEREGIPVDDPGIVFGHVHDLRVGGLNHDGISLSRDGLLGRAFQVS